MQKQNGRKTWMSVRRTASSLRGDRLGAVEITGQAGSLPPQHSRFGKSQHIGQSLYLAHTIDAGERRLALREQFAVAQELVAMLDLHMRRPHENRPQRQKIVVARRA